MNVYHKVMSASQNVLLGNVALMLSLVCGSCSEQKGPANTTASSNTNTTAERASNAVVVGAQKVGEKIGGAVQQVQSTAEKTYDAVKSGAEKAGEHITNGTRKVAEAVKDTAQKVEDKLKQ
jgi:phage-related protein